jgi:ubiquinone/menaquinone biosynthesis C-methylase UbiE
MAVPFDHIASTHDSVFTRSAIGQLQRKRVWKYVETIIPELRGFEMLELNCGSGEDADLFGEKGFNIIATDISEEMLKITNKRGSQYSMQNKISSHYLDLDSLNETLFDKKFDLVFSNFGGINCINPQSLKKLLENLPSMLNPGGRFIGVVMPKFCAWETIFFMFRFQFKKAFRRYTSQEVISDLHGNDLKTWFYRPSDIKRWSKDKFRLINMKPVGLALPAAYLERFVTFRKHWLMRLDSLEKKVSHSGLFSGMADNFIIDLQLMA